MVKKNPRPVRPPSTGLPPHTAEEITPPAAHPSEMVRPPAFYVNPHRNFKNWYKGAVHTHSNLSDGGYPTSTVLQSHHDFGYNFIFLTDHHKPSPPDLPAVEGLLYFRHYRSFECGQKWSHHILVLGIDPDCIGSYYQQDEVDPDRNGTVALPTDNPAHLPERLGYYEHIGMAVVAHPHLEHHDKEYGTLLEHPAALPGAGWSLEELLAFCRIYTGIEIFNSSEAGVKAWYEGVWGDQDPGRLKHPMAVDWWDEVLKTGRRVWGFAGDDSHYPVDNGTSFNRSWIVVNSSRPFEDTPDMERNIIENIRQGNFYCVVRRPEARDIIEEQGPADRGPELKIGCLGRTIIVKTDRISDIAFHICPDTGEMRREMVTSVMSASFDRVTPQDKYVRIVVHQVRDCEYYQVFSQPLFVIKGNPG